MHPDTLPVIVILVSVIVGMLWIGSMVDARLSGAIRALEDSEERCRAVIDGMLDAHVTADSSGLIQTMNPAAEKLLMRWPRRAAAGHAAVAPETMRQTAPMQSASLRDGDTEYENAAAPGRQPPGKSKS
ncbi:MAG: PAS domain-containing protein [Gammaproteobacteria bacterium]